MDFAAGEWSFLNSCSLQQVKMPNTELVQKQFGRAQTLWADFALIYSLQSWGGKRSTLALKKEIPGFPFLNCPSLEEI